MNWCPYHPEQAQFLGPVTESRMSGPSGRFTCCGQQAFRYETLPGPMVYTHTSSTSYSLQAKMNLATSRSLEADSCI